MPPPPPSFSRLSHFLPLHFHVVPAPTFFVLLFVYRTSPATILHYSTPCSTPFTPFTSRAVRSLIPQPFSPCPGGVATPAGYTGSGKMTGRAEGLGEGKGAAAGGSGVAQRWNRFDVSQRYPRRMTDDYVIQRCMHVHGRSPRSRARLSRVYST